MRRPPGPVTELVPGSLWFGQRPKLGFSARRAGFDLVVDLLAPEEERRVGEHHAEVGVMWLRVPLDDVPWEPAPALLDTAVAVVVTAIRRGQRVLVHCASGRNRSGLVTALVLRRLDGRTGQEAVNAVRLARRGALSNPVFAVQVKREAVPTEGAVATAVLGSALSPADTAIVTDAPLG